MTINLYSNVSDNRDINKKISLITSGVNPITSIKIATMLIYPNMIDIILSVIRDLLGEVEWSCILT